MNNTFSESSRPDISKTTRFRNKNIKTFTLWKNRALKDDRAPVAIPHSLRLTAVVLLLYGRTVVLVVNKTEQTGRPGGGGFTFSLKRNFIFPTEKRKKLKNCFFARICFSPFTFHPSDWHVWILRPVFVYFFCPARRFFFSACLSLTLNPHQQQQCL